jgi:amino acid transporter
MTIGKLALRILWYAVLMRYRVPWMAKASDIDVLSGQEEVDRLCENDFDRQPRNWLERVWRWMA